MLLYVPKYASKRFWNATIMSVGNTCLLVHLPGNGVAKRLSSIALHVLRQPPEAVAIWKLPESIQHLLCMGVCVLAAAADVLHHKPCSCEVFW